MAKEGWEGNDDEEYDWNEPRARILSDLLCMRGKKVDNLVSVTIVISTNPVMECEGHDGHNEKHDSQCEEQDFVFSVPF